MIRTNGTLDFMVDAIVACVHAPERICSYLGFEAYSSYGNRAKNVHSVKPKAALVWEATSTESEIVILNSNSLASQSSHTYVNWLMSHSNTLLRINFTHLMPKSILTNIDNGIIIKLA